MNNSFYDHSHRDTCSLGLTSDMVDSNITGEATPLEGGKGQLTTKGQSMVPPGGFISAGEHRVSNPVYVSEGRRNPSEPHGKEPIYETLDLPSVSEWAGATGMSEGAMKPSDEKENRAEEELRLFENRVRSRATENPYEL